MNVGSRKTKIRHQDLYASVKPGSRINDREDEKEPLLRPSALKNKADKTQRNSSQKVQWNDRNGAKLEQVVVFEQSDSDSDDEYQDTCFCAVM